MHETPFSFQMPTSDDLLTPQWDSHLVRSLSAMQGQYQDQAAYAAMLAHDDQVLYEVYELDAPHVAGALLQGISVIYPGKVGSEYFMTKGHFHAILDTGEVYYCLRGEGMIVMETPEGEWNVQPFRPGQAVSILPRWAHRSVNVSATDDLVFYYVCPANAGHDYGTIEHKGFRKLVVERAGKPEVIDNPRWNSA